MIDVCFDANGIYVALQDSISVEKKVQSSVDELANIASTLNDEISSFVNYGKDSAGIIQAQISQVYNMIAIVDQKIAMAESKRQSEAKLPARPYVSPDTPPHVKDAMMSNYQKNVNQVSAQNTRIREQNNRISNYVAQCNHAKGQLNLIIGRMLGVEGFVKKETSSTATATKELLGQINKAAREGSAINSAMSDFYSALNQVYHVAEAIEVKSPSSVRGSSWNRQFKIKNTHNHIVSNSGGSGYVFSSNQSSILDVSSVSINDPSAELFIKSKDEVSFFESLQDAIKIKMPSANLRKLGGEAFVAKMKQSGYVAIVQENGTIIDMDGKIHWEKKH